MMSGRERSTGTAPGRQDGTRPRSRMSPRLRRTGPAAGRRTPGDELRPWTDAAACRSVDPELFFPVGRADYQNSLAQVQEAKEVCRQCPVLDACRAWALTYPRLAEFGVWGGTTEQERRTERSRTRLAARRL